MQQPPYTQYQAPTVQSKDKLGGRVGAVIVFLIGLLADIIALMSAYSIMQISSNGLVGTLMGAQDMATSILTFFVAMVIGQGLTSLGIILAVFSLKE